jgi:vancomycin permeability regulator SanA
VAIPNAMELTPEEIAKITSYVDATTPLPEQADLLFVFGTRLLNPAQIAVELYLQQRAPLIVLTGGVNRYTGVNEANVYYELLIEAGIPAEKIIVENSSTNTLENVTFALPLIEQKLPLHSTHSVLAICKWMHSRRALMTLKRHFPPGIRYYAYTYEPENITRENWYLSPRAESANVLKNWEQIPQYLVWGHIEEVFRDGDSYI